MKNSLVLRKRSMQRGVTLLLDSRCAPLWLTFIIAACSPNSAGVSESSGASGAGEKVVGASGQSSDAAGGQATSGMAIGRGGSGASGITGASSQGRSGQGSGQNSNASGTAGVGGGTALSGSSTSGILGTMDAGESGAENAEPPADASVGEDASVPRDAATPRDAAVAEADAAKAGPPLPGTWIPVSGYQSTKNVPHGKVELLSYNNPVLNMTRKANVYTPPGYDASNQYPVLYALHGIGGTENEWLQYNTNVNEILDNLLASSKIVPMVVVFPNGRAMNPDSVPSDLYGSANTQAFHDFWSKDMKNYLIPFIQKTFSVYTDKSHRAVLGYSMGGGQALEMGLPNPDYFEFIGAMAPAYRPDVSTLSAAQINSEFEEIFLSAGTNDQVVGYAPILAFHNSLVSAGIDHIWVSVQGGAHDGTTWCPGMYNFTQLIFK